MLRIAAFLVLLLSALITTAQDANIDLSFNPGDVGYNFGNGANASVLCMVVQPDGKIIIGGEFTTYNGTGRGYLARLNADGTLDNSFFSGTGANAKVKDLALQPDGKVIIVGEFTTVHGATWNRVARLNTDGSVDNGFTIGTGANNPVNEVLLQADGKVIVAGSFFSFNGVNRPFFVRLNSNGTVDTPFPAVTTAFAGTINDLVVQTDGRIIIAGDFTSYDGQPRTRMARLNSNGSLDLTFDPGFGPNQSVSALALQSDGNLLVCGSFTSYNATSCPRVIRVTTTGALDGTFSGYPGLFATVACMIIRSDGKIVVGGYFGLNGDLSSYSITRLQSNGALDASFVFEPTLSTTSVICMAQTADGKLLVGTTCLGISFNIARLLADGALDISFNPGTSSGYYAEAVAFQPDGKAIIGGSFMRYNGVICKRIVRVNADGGIDPTFVTGSGFNATVKCLYVLPDGKILVGGTFTKYNGVVRAGLVRLNADGSLDATFLPSMNSSDRTVNEIIVQPDGKILVAGGFTLANGIPRNRVCRFLADGTLDTTFDPGIGPNSTVEALALQADGKVLIGGQFNTVSGNTSTYVARLNSNGTFDGSFNVGTGASDWVYSLCVLADGRVLVGGQFSTFNGNTYRNLVRLNTNGSVDTGFPAQGPGLNSVSRIHEMPDGRILLCGFFFSLNGGSRYHIARLMPNGTVDPTFDTATGADQSVGSFSLRSDGRILAGGTFTAYKGTGRNFLTLIHGTSMVAVKAFLQGPFNGTTMADSLRRQGSIPLTEPFTGLGYAQANYTAGSTILSSVLSTTGNNAIVDWVLLEMRPTAQPNTVAAARAVLVQRDGDVVDLDGRSPVGFPGLPDGSYVVALRSRNHLPVMLSTGTPINFGTGVPIVDLTQASTQVYDADARMTVGAVQVLAQGDVSRDQAVQYTGIGNDRDPILVRVGGTNPNNTVSGYYLEDVNMDGVVKYTGTNNDRDPILVTIGGTEPTVIRAASLP